MKVLIFGRGGQLANELAQLYPQALVIGRSDCDLRNFNQLESFLRAMCPAIIINAAAYTAVDQAERDVEVAYQVNCIAPQVMAAYAADRNIPLVHYSSDYVFDGGQRRPYVEDDVPHPLNVYGSSKESGESVIIETCGASGNPHYILRTSCLYGGYRPQANFIQIILDKARLGESLRIVSDQRTTPTSAKWLAQITQNILNHMSTVPSGLYHAVPRGEASWYGLAAWVIEVAKHTDLLAGVESIKLDAIVSEQYLSLATRPKYSCLDHQHLLRALSLPIVPHWQEQVATYVEELSKNRGWQASA